MFDLAGKVAVVTGASRGIGRAIAEAMAGAGARVVVSSRKIDACEAVAKAIRATGGEAVAVACHVGRREMLQDLVAASRREWGGIDILVCNASVNPYYGPLAEIAEEAYDKTMDANVKGTLWLCNMVLPEMAERGGGSVLITTSTGGFKGRRMLGIYSISKAAQMGLVRNLAIEWGPRNIRVNGIAPGVIRTDFARALYEDPDRERAILRVTPLGRLGEPEDAAGAALFLCSDAAGYITGEILTIDGGRLMSN